MRPFGVVEPDPVVDYAFGLEAVLQFEQIDGLLPEGSPESLDEYIVEIPASSIHGVFYLASVS